MAKGKSNGSRRRTPTKNGNGPSTQPSKRLRKLFQYTEAIKLNNSTSEYSYYSKYIKPDITKAVGANAQFAAYELWRLTKIKVSIQMAQSASGDSATNAMTNATSSTVWTAADFGANESVSGVTIMQYQNAKKNTPSLNKWTNIVDTTSRINSKLTGNYNYDFIMPGNTMVNTSNFDSSFYSGYQLFIQNFGSQNQSVEYQPSYTLITQLEVEFLQPAFQNLPSTFVSNAFTMRMVAKPTPDSERVYVFDRILVEKDEYGNRQMFIRLTREDGEPGSLTFTSAELRNAIATGTSGAYFSGRSIVYDGPYPPREIPDQDFQITTDITN